jgi:hypothetical protein
MTPLHVYATLSAVEESQMLGFIIRRDDWRDIFLAITDTLAGDGQQSIKLTAARYVGPVRIGERWSVVIVGQARFDVLYDPSQARIYRVAQPRDLAGAMAHVPSQPSPGAFIDPA